MKKVAFLSLGCKTNQYELQALKEIFEGKGYKIVKFGDEADAYIINTCTVTQESARKSRQMIRRANRKDAIVAIMGCYSQLEAKAIENIDSNIILAGTRNRKEIVKKVEEALGSLSSDIIVDDGDYEELQISNFAEQKRAYLKIEDGCDNFCSYCIIPYARGGIIKSRNLQNIVDEANRLANAGYREIVITGINICKYQDGKNSLIDVIEKT